MSLIMLESKKLTRTVMDSTACEFPDCGSAREREYQGYRSATTVLYIAGYPLGSFCDVHAKVMRAAWLTDEALLSQRPQAVAA